MNREDLIAQARRLLKDLEMDDQRSNERSALTLLALARLDSSKSWDKATNEMFTTRELMDWIRDNLGQDYAANTRETIRRFTLHQFVAGGIVEENADRPDRPINSPKWNYRLTPTLMPVIKSIQGPEYQYALVDFLEGVDTWKQQQDEIREKNKVPVLLPDGSEVKLSAGGQNTLIKQMVEDFCPRFSPGGKVLYIDDTAKDKGKIDSAMLEAIGVVMPDRGKAPDLIVWMEDRQWLFLMEACSTHGPIDVIRKRELTEMFAGAAGSAIFISCFPDRATMRNFLIDLAWETEAWCSSDPDHMVHLDGEKFLGPYA